VWEGRTGIRAESAPVEVLDLEGGLTTDLAGRVPVLEEERGEAAQNPPVLGIQLVCGRERVCVCVCCVVCVCVCVCERARVSEERE
jgi:hypothetical protein